MKRRAMLALAVSAVTGCSAYAQPATDPRLPPRTEVELSSQVAGVFTPINPEPRTLLAIRILELDRADDYMEQCMAALGLPYARRAVVASWPNSATAGVRGGWWTPPYFGNPAAGFGVGEQIDPSDTVADEEIVVEDLRLAADEQASYDAGVATCTPNTPSGPLIDWSVADDIREQMIAISSATRAKPGFVAIQETYRRCIEIKGFDFADPDLLIDLVMARYSDPGAHDPVGFESSAALADAECRVDLWPEFIELSRPEWEAFVAANHDRARAMIDSFIMLEAQAGELMPVPEED